MLIEYPAMAVHWFYRVGGAEMKHMKLTPSRVIMSNDDNTGQVGIVRYEGGQIVATSRSGITVYRGYNERAAAKAIIKHQVRNERIKRLE